MKINRALRYLAPNLITALGVSFGLLSLVAAFEGRYVDSAWLIIYSVMTDRLDGFVARLVRGTSELGVQMDSFADFLNFGVAPAVLMFFALGSDPSLHFSSGSGRTWLMVAGAVWIFGALFRLARYNITTEQAPAKVFFGVPTTLAAGLLCIWFLTLVKYNPVDAPLAVEPFGGRKLFGAAISTPVTIWRFFPFVLVIGGVLMASNLRMPKLGLTRSKLATTFIFTNVFLGYVFGFSRVFPEYMIWPPTMWLVIFLVWGAISREARSLTPPPLFPEVDPPPGLEPVRPEDDLLPEGEDITLDAEDLASQNSEGAAATGSEGPT